MSEYEITRLPHGCGVRVVHPRTGLVEVEERSLSTPMNEDLALERLEERVQRHDRAVRRALTAKDARPMTNTSAQALNLLVRKLREDANLLTQYAEKQRRTNGACPPGDNTFEDAAAHSNEAADFIATRPDTVPSEGVATDWQDISTAPTGDEIFIAYCPPDAAFPDGRQMFVRGSILVSMRKPKTSNHLQFPATHWRWQAAPPALTPIESNDK